MYSGYQRPEQQVESIPLDDGYRYDHYHDYNSYRGFTPTVNENPNNFSGYPNAATRHHSQDYTHSMGVAPTHPQDGRFDSMNSMNHRDMMGAHTIPDNQPIIDYEPQRPSNRGDGVRSSKGYLDGGKRKRKNNNRKYSLENWKNWPFLCWLLGLIQLSVFIAELAKMGALTGSPIQTKPSFNPMIGPSSYVQINMGARFTPCMHKIKGITDEKIQFPCPNSTDADTNVCSLGELCGMGGIDGDTPDQWWRFITPIFLHAGFVHIGFNMLMQLTIGSQMEQDIGSVRFFFVYFASGIAGFVLGGNFTPNGIASTGASGSLFGVVAIDFLDLLFNWPLYVHPWRNLLMHVLTTVVSFVLGLLPGLDNFSHIGGFAMGLLVGTALLRSPYKIRLQTVDVLRPQDDGELKTEKRTKVARFHWKSPHRHFHNRSPWWWVWLGVRASCIVLAIVYFVTLINEFEHGGGDCSWCYRLSCLPVHGWCDQGKIQTTTSSNPSNSRRWM